MNIISGYDIVLDATDNVATRYLLNDACVLGRKPLVSGSALQVDYLIKNVIPSTVLPDDSLSVRGTINSVQSERRTMLQMHFSNSSTTGNSD